MNIRSKIRLSRFKCVQIFPNMNFLCNVKTDGRVHCVKFLVFSFSEQWSQCPSDCYGWELLWQFWRGKNTILLNLIKSVFLTFQFVFTAVKHSWQGSSWRGRFNQNVPQETQSAAILFVQWYSSLRQYCHQ